VRYLSNASSGKMGYAVAAAARRRGARTTLVAGPTALAAPAGVRVLSVTSARDMLAACLKNLPGADLIVGAAAVGDWRPAQASKAKIKKGRVLALRLVPNPDVIAALARRKKAGAVAAGFALETGGLKAKARAKMSAKGLDLIVANGPDALDGDRTRALLITRDGRAAAYRGTKSGLADKILDAAEALL
jgi:phosphopantothenoylcysteine decarboxylase/phosphopantothenate--cysteine ligase